MSSSSPPSSSSNLSALQLRTLYPAKKPWPPNVTTMDPKHQFRLERRYRRRAQLAYMSPKWVRGVKLVQFTAIMGVIAYAGLWMDWGGIEKREKGEQEETGYLGKVREAVGVQEWKSGIDEEGAKRRIEEVVRGRGWGGSSAGTGAGTG